MQGEVVYLYAFDVANEIMTSGIHQILARTPFAFEIRTDQPYPREMPLYKPLAIEPPPLATPLHGQSVSSLVHVYDIGVVTVSMRVAFDVAGLVDLLPLHKPVLEDGQSLDRAARDLCVQVCKSLSGVMIDSSPPPDSEAYTVFCLGTINDVNDAGQWIQEHRGEVAGLLTETAPERLSDMQVNEVLRIQRSFEKGDAVVIDWDAALVIDLTGYFDDVLYVLELANVQLEEFRVMDQRLDRYLNRAYEDLNRRRSVLFGFSPAILQSLRLFVVDVTKLADEVSHFVKFFGDWHLARVYLGTSERFYLDHWRRSVEDRLGQLDKLYSALNAEIYNKRLMWLEVIIVVFFAIDVVMLFLKR